MQKDSQIINFSDVDAAAVIAPSGGGKGGYMKRLTETYPDKFVVSISDTSKPEDGSIYTFISREEFEKRISEDYYIESEEYAENLYGTPRKNLEEAKGSGKILLFEIEVNGARKMKKLFKEMGKKFLYIFIDSGNDISVYEKRIEERGRKGDENNKEKRKAKIPYELKMAREDADVTLYNTTSDKEDLLAPIAHYTF